MLVLATLLVLLTLTLGIFIKMATKQDLDQALESLAAKVDSKSAEVLAAINAIAQVEDLQSAVDRINAIREKVDSIPTTPSV